MLPDNPRPASGGFTLTELLVATVVGVAVLLLSMLALRNGFDAWGHLVSTDRESLVAAQLLARIERDAASALPLPGRPFEGSAKGLRTTRLVAGPQPAGPASPVEVEWFFDPDSRSVTRRERPLGAPETAWAQQESFAPVRAFRLSYAAPPATAGQPPVWQEAWSPPTKTGLPAAVRIALSAAGRTLPCRLRATGAPLPGDAQ